MAAVMPPSDTGEGVPLIEWYTATQPFGGATVSGDLDVVVYYPGGALAAVIDGLGHGPEAALAAGAAAAVLRQQPAEPVAELMGLCHEALRGTRGAVISLASFDGATATVTWLGVGNVAGILLRHAPRELRAREDLLPRPGVVGYRIPRLHPAHHSVRRGDLLLLASDGIKTNFHRGLTTGRPVDVIATEILHHHGRDSDDALVLVVLCSGMPP
jgi:phosphoserine phosphatase RsbX